MDIRSPHPVLIGTYNSLMYKVRENIPWVLPIVRGGIIHKVQLKYTFSQSPTHRGCNLLLYFFQLFTSLLIFYLFVTIYINITFPLFFYLPLFLVFFFNFLPLTINLQFSLFLYIVFLYTNGYFSLSLTQNFVFFMVDIFKTFSSISTLG